MSLPDDVRSHCAAVADRARHVRIDHEALPAYAAGLSGHKPEADPAERAHILQLNAVNFGSGWFPTLRKRPGMSGFRTIEAGLSARGPWPREELVRLDAAAVADAFGQDPGHELMELYAAALDWELWRKGGGPRYKARPRHRARTTAY